MRWALLPVAIVILAVGLWPSRPVEPQAMQGAYTSALMRYRDTPYVWGGETGRGLDCSGLIRRGLMDALLDQGLRTGNPSLWRDAAFLWWHDCSAREMKDGYRGLILRRSEEQSLNGMHAVQLNPGDIAVTRNGVHVLAYLGAGRWIQADPNLTNGGDKVIVTSVPSRSGWFNQRVVICRWVWLEKRIFHRRDAETQRFSRGDKEML